MQRQFTSCKTIPNRRKTCFVWLLVVFFVAFFELFGSGRTSQAFAGQLSELPAACSQFAQSTSQGGELLRALSADGSAISYGRLGQFYLEGGEVECARLAFQNAVSKDPELWKAHYGLGLAFLQQNKADRAAQELQLMLRHTPQDAMAHNALGLAFEAMGTYESSEQEFRTALDLDPQFDLACFNLAHVLGAQKKYPAVLFYLKKALALAPQEPAYRLALGTAYIASGDFDAAIRALNELLITSPDSAEAYFQLGNAYQKLANPQMAGESYRHVLHLDPQNGPARVLLAEALLTSGNAAEAVTVLKDYTRQQSGDSQAYYLLGRAYRDLNQLREARESLEQAVRTKPDDYTIRYELGFVLEHLGLGELAREQLQTAVQLNPEESQAHRELSKVLRGLNEAGRASEEFQKYLALEANDRNKKSAAALHAQAIAAMKRGETIRAIGLYREALKLDSSDPQIEYDFALALGEGGDRREQELHLRRTIKLDPNLAGAHCQLGSVYLDEGKTEEAETEVRTALSIDPQYIEAQVTLGVLYDKEGKKNEAGKLFRQAIETSPKFAAAHANLGLLLASQGHDVEAEEELKQAIQIAPREPSVLRALASLQSKSGRLIDATCTLKSLSELQPRSVQAHLNFGTALTALYFYEAALEEFSSAEHLDPNSGLVRLYTGRTLYDLGRIAEARKELRAACQLSPKVAACWYLFGLLERQAKDIPLSVNYLGQAVRLEPQNAEAKFLLGQSWFELGQTEKAIECWKMALQASPDQWRALYSLAQAGRTSRDTEARKYQGLLQDTELRNHVSQEVGLIARLAHEAASARDWSSAISRYQEALRYCGRCESAVELHRALGITYCQIGRLASGEREFLNALQIEPDDSRTAETLRRIRAARKDSQRNGWLSLCTRSSPADQAARTVSDTSH